MIITILMLKRLTKIVSKCSVIGCLLINSFICRPGHSFIVWETFGPRFIIWIGRWIYGCEVLTKISEGLLYLRTECSHPCVILMPSSHTPGTSSEWYRCYCGRSCSWYADCIVVMLCWSKIVDYGRKYKKILTFTIVTLCLSLILRNGYMCGVCIWFF